MNIYDINIKIQIVSALMSKGKPEIATCFINQHTQITRASICAYMLHYEWHLGRVDFIYTTWLNGDAELRNKKGKTKCFDRVLEFIRVINLIINTDTFQRQLIMCPRKANIANEGNERFAN